MKTELNSVKQKGGIRMPDYSKLRGKIKEKGFSSLMGIAAATLSSKFKGLSYFNTEEIKKAVKLLDIPTMDIYEYFFDEKTE